MHFSIEFWVLKEWFRKHISPAKEEHFIWELFVEKSCDINITNIDLFLLIYKSFLSVFLQILFNYSR